MPYAKKEAREKLTQTWDDPIKAPYLPDNAGELNYVITRTILEYVAKHGEGKLNYGLLNECVGVLECAKLELYRRMVAPYEDTKIKENGDVYPNV